MSKVSIIVPVYNNEKYIAACVESILGQSHSDLQVILVNDGSTDKSGEICDSYAAADNRVVVIHKPNSGVSDTRNAGLAIADGEYIAFVDSDDTVHANFIELLLKNIQGHDMSIGGVQQNFLNENRSHILEVKNKVFSISDFKKHMKITICSQYINPNWNKMFKTEIVKSNNIMFRTDMNVSEDCVFNLTYLDKCKTIKAFSDVIYYYNVRTDYTRSESYKKSRFYDRIKMCKILEAFYSSDSAYFYKRILSEYMFIAYYEMMDNKNITDHKTFLRNYISENGLMPLVARTNYNILDKKIFFKSAAELIDKAALDEISLNKVKQ